MSVCIIGWNFRTNTSHKVFSVTPKSSFWRRHVHFTSITNIRSLLRRFTSLLHASKWRPTFINVYVQSVLHVKQNTAAFNLHTVLFIGNHECGRGSEWSKQTVVKWQSPPGKYLNHCFGSGIYKTRTSWLTDLTSERLLANFISCRRAKTIAAPNYAVMNRSTIRKRKRVLSC